MKMEPENQQFKLKVVTASHQSLISWTPRTSASLITAALALPPGLPLLLRFSGSAASLFSLDSHELSQLSVSQDWASRATYLLKYSTCSSHELAAATANACTIMFCTSAERSQVKSASIPR